MLQVRTVVFTANLDVTLDIFDLVDVNCVFFSDSRFLAAGIFFRRSGRLGAASAYLKAYHRVKSGSLLVIAVEASHVPHCELIKVNVSVIVGVNIVEDLGGLIASQFVEAQAVNERHKLGLVDQARVVSVVLVKRCSNVLLDVLRGC